MSDSRQPAPRENLRRTTRTDPQATTLSVVVPALNEADRLPPTLERIGSFLGAHCRWLPAEIIVVDDGSSDNTGDAALSVKTPTGVETRLATHDINRGKGAAVRTGFALSRGALVLLTDADLSAPIEELGILCDAVDDGFVAIGSRAVNRQLIAQRQPRHRDVMGRTFNLAVQALGLTNHKDTQCGFKLYPGDLARSLAAVQQIDGFAFDVEHLVVAQHWGFSTRELGVRWSHVEASRVLAVRHSMQMLRDVVRIAWRRASGSLSPRPEALK